MKHHKTTYFNSNKLHFISHEVSLTKKLKGKLKPKPHRMLNVGIKDKGQNHVLYYKGNKIFETSRIGQFLLEKRISGGLTY